MTKSKMYNRAKMILFINKVRIFAQMHLVER